MAARTDWQLTVIRATANARNDASAKSAQGIGIRTAKFSSHLRPTK